MSTIANHQLTWVATQANTVVLVFTVASGLIVFLRLFTRFVLSKAAGFEDACIAFAMTLAVALAVTVAQQAMHGLGKHHFQLDDDQRDVLLKAFWAELWIYNLALTVTKVAILIQYLRIFPVRRFCIACYGMLILVLAAGGWTVISSILLCSPVTFFWDKDIPNGHCMNEFIIWFTNAGLNIGQDVVILFMPLPVINTLQIPKVQKTALITMFGLGASTTLVSVIRLSSLQSISNSTDVSWDNPAHASLSAVEVNVGIICACLPAMRPLLALMMPKYFSGSPQYTSIPPPNMTRVSHLRKPSANTNGYTTRPISTKTMVSRTMTPQPNNSLQTLRPVLSQPASGRISVRSKYSLENTSQVPVFARSARTSTLHSRSGSNVTFESASTALRPKPLKIKPQRFQGEINPLRMSPVTPFSPPSMNGNSPWVSGVDGNWPLTRSNTTVSSSARPWTANADIKPLPITPFPVGVGV